MSERLRDVRQRLFSPAVGTTVFDIASPATPPAAAAGSEGPVTLAAIAGLLKQEITPVKESMQSLERQIGDLSLATDKRMGILEERVTDMESHVKETDARIAKLDGMESRVESRMDNSDLRVSKLEQIIEEGVSQYADPALGERVRALETQLAQLRTEHKNTDGDMTSEMERTAVVSGLVGLPSKSEATAWLREKLWHTYAPDPVTDGVYCKGDFNGILFAKFASKSERDAAVKSLKQAGSKVGDKTVWAKPDMPVNLRALRSVAFGGKRVFVEEWGYDKSSIWAEVDETGANLWHHNDLVLAAKIEDHSLITTYGDGWEEYLNKDTHPQINNLLQMNRQKVAGAATKSSGKGKSKGKPPGKGAGKR